MPGRIFPRYLNGVFVLGTGLCIKKNIFDLCTLIKHNITCCIRSYLSVMNLSIYLPKELVKQIKTEASKDHRSVSQFIRLTLIKSLNKRNNHG